MAEKSSRSTEPREGQEPNGAEQAITDLPQPEVARKDEAAVRGGAALPTEKQRSIANDTVRVT